MRRRRATTAGGSAHRPRRAALAGLAALLTAALAVSGPGEVWAAFTGTTASTGNQLATETVFPDYRTAVQNSGPVVYHPFDDAYGSSTAGALAGTAGTYNGAATASSASTTAIATSAGGPRKAVRFPAGTHAAADATTSLDGGAVNTLKLTLEAWVRTGRGGAVVSLLPEGSTSASGRPQLYVNAAGQVCVGLTLESQTLQEVCGYDASDAKAWTSADQASPAWHHVAAVIDPTAPAGTVPCDSTGTQVVVYVDGAVVYDRGLCATWPRTLAGRWRVGSAPITTDVIAATGEMEGPAPDTWTGDVDEVAVYTGALSAAEIEKHHDVGRGTVAGDYAATVRAVPSLHLYWQLDGVPGPGSGRTVADASTHARHGTHHGYPVLPADGAPTGTSTPGTAVGLSGVNDVSTGAGRTTPAAFSTEVWFRSTGGTGPLASFGSSQTGTSTVPDVALYLTAGGNLAFSIRPLQRTVVSTRDHRDGVWHLATSTMSAGGRMRLYVDGVLVGEDASSTTTGTSTGFWRWGGGGDYSSFSPQPGAPFFTGRLDEASVYDRELSSEDVAIHWGARF
ncbi:Concanavalin A-like lectin/glucanases superfamily protein [Geodermatophilus pulveris]|uniref:Concanavalin A-like lectin/glucanases superfamily protein n=1 Tax=Geodermatophilus pulveris TaxID=1564159 RepID=A0A239GFG3_9ACTN|nr:LamG-like jellyroll fold domain-containing protein [Geodermatophilus pulveris]SNS67781.1 Concanavalin A-like lectin/glucanases superfamily protein [Geodermatophilus pulveris]